MKIVLAHHDRLVLKSLELLISQCAPGSHFAFCENGIEAWEELSRDWPSVLVINDYLPETRGALGKALGKTIIQRLSSQKIRIPIFLMTEQSLAVPEATIDSVGEGLDVTFVPARTSLEHLWCLASLVQKRTRDNSDDLPPFENAINVLQAVVRREPRSGIAHYLLGEAYEVGRQYEEAIEEFADAKHFDDDCDACDAVGQLAENVFPGGRAINILCKITAKYPEDFDFKYALAWAFRRGDKLAEAEHVYREILARAFAPGSPHELSYEWQASLQLELSSTIATSDESVALVEQALPRLGSEWNRNEIENDLAADCLQLGRFEDALRIYLGWIKDANPVVGLTGNRFAPHSPRDTHDYKQAQARLLALLELHMRTPDSKADLFTRGRFTLQPASLGKLYIALRCCEELGEVDESKLFHAKGMECFGK